MSWFKSIPSSLFYIPLSIFIAKETEVLFKYFGITFASPNTTDYWFVAGFIEWFGVLYGMLLPLILLRAWEQLDEIDRQFDREADTAKMLYNDLDYLSDLPVKFSRAGNEITKLLHKYVEHVAVNYRYEIKQLDDDKKSKEAGDKILEDMREKFKVIVRLNTTKTIVSETLINELLEKINELVDNRGDRISYASQRLFENLHYGALITSIIFLIPFYFVGPTYFARSIGFPYFYLLDTVLVLGVTFLVIYIYMIIEDLDEPFDGVKKISDESWKLLCKKMNKDQKERDQKLLEELSVKSYALQPPTKAKRKPKGKSAISTSSTQTPP